SSLSVPTFPPSSCHTASHSPLVFFKSSDSPGVLPSSPTRRSSDLTLGRPARRERSAARLWRRLAARRALRAVARGRLAQRARKRSEEHTSELQSLTNLVCRLLLEKKKTHTPDTEARDSESIAVPTN